MLTLPALADLVHGEALLLQPLAHSDHKSGIEVDGPQVICLMAIQEVAFNGQLEIHGLPRYELNEETLLDP